MDSRRHNIAPIKLAFGGPVNGAFLVSFEALQEVVVSHLSGTPSASIDTLLV